MVAHKAIASLLQRTLPAAIPPEYDRTPEGRPPQTIRPRSDVLYGLVASAVADNRVTLTPCTADGAGIAGAAAVIVYAGLPPDVGHAIGAIIGQQVAYCRFRLPITDSGDAIAGWVIAGGTIGNADLVAYEWWVRFTAEGSVTLVNADLRGHVIEVGGEMAVGNLATVRAAIWARGPEAFSESLLGDLYSGSGGTELWQFYDGGGNTARVYISNADGSLYITCVSGFTSEFHVRVCVRIGGLKVAPDLTV